MIMTNVSLKELIAPSFYNLHNILKTNKYTHYFIKGGRGSLKSSATSIEVVLELNRDINANAIILRKYATVLNTSVLAQYQWAIDKLGQTDNWEIYKSPAKIVNKQTGQTILFRGVDDPTKLKSTKFLTGFCKVVVYEEADQFDGMEEIRNINQTLLRGGYNFRVFYIFNPPESQQHWINQEVLIPREDRYIHHSTYLSAPRSWLGDQFFIEAEHLAKVNEKKYDHEYLGIITGTGGSVFKNLTIRSITQEEINTFDNIKRGIDFGYAVDPFHYAVCNYNKKKKQLYVYYEIQVVGLSNKNASDLIKKENSNNKLVTADSAEPKSIDEIKSYGINIDGAKKGPDSREYGYKFLQDLEEIIIDPNTCPNTTKEFTSYEYDKDKFGNYKARYPDGNDHSIDAIRYALESEMLNSNNKLTFVGRR